MVFNRNVQRLVQAYIEGRLAILTPKKLILLGEYIEDGGYQYSNLSYREDIYTAKYAPKSFDQLRSGKTECECCGETVNFTWEVEGLRCCAECLRYLQPYNSPSEGMRTGYYYRDGQYYDYRSNPWNGSP